MHRQRQALRAAGEMEIKHIAVTGEIDAAIGERRHRRMHQAEFETTHVDDPLFTRYQPCGSESRMPSASSCFSMNLMRSGEAVGSGGEVGPTGRPMITQPPLSEDGY